MKIGIQTWGSEGDMRPFIALAAGLSAAGHKVTLAVTEVTPTNVTSFGERLGFTVRHVGEDNLNGNEIKEFIQSIFQEKHSSRQSELLTANFIAPILDDLLGATKTLCSENDLVIGQNSSYPLKIAATKSKCPYVMVFLIPMIPSKNIPPVGFPALGKPMNRLWWKMLDKVINRTWKPLIDRMSVCENIETKPSVMHDIWHSPLLNLVAVSPALFPPPGDWEKNFHMCGFFNIPEQAAAWEMPRDLEQFLDAGEPPVYITFGSMLTFEPDPRQKLELLIEAIRLAGCRGIIQANWDDYKDIQIPAEIYPIIRAPHQHIFPRCQAVVHHGGAGTTQAVTISGCPSIVVEHAFDQSLWGTILHQRGIAPKLLHRRTLTAGKLANALKTVLKSRDMKKKAENIGSKMVQEDGIDRAVELIEKYCKF